MYGSLWNAINAFCAPLQRGWSRCRQPLSPPSVHCLSIIFCVLCVCHHIDTFLSLYSYFCCWIVQKIILSASLEHICYSKWELPWYCITNRPLCVDVSSGCLSLGLTARCCPRHWHWADQEGGGQDHRRNHLEDPERPHWGDQRQSGRFRMFYELTGDQIQRTIVVCFDTLSNTMSPLCRPPGPCGSRNCRDEDHGRQQDVEWAGEDRRSDRRIECPHINHNIYVCLSRALWMGMGWRSRQEIRRRSRRRRSIVIR